MTNTRESAEEKIYYAIGNNGRTAKIRATGAEKVVVRRG